MRSMKTLTVTDIKQFLYCPRVVYFTYCMPLVRPTTHKMDLGKSTHTRERVLQKRRSLVKYQLIEGQRRFDIDLLSERLGLYGVLDMAIFTASEAIPVEFKMSTKGMSLNHKYQLAAYGMLLEDVLWMRSRQRDLSKTISCYRRYVRRGFIHYIPTRRVVEVSLTQSIRSQVKQIIQEISDMLDYESMPDPTRMKNRCTDCEFKRFCSDIN